MKRFQHRLEFALLWLFFRAFRTLPLDVASCIGGWMGRAVGPFLRAHRVAAANLAMIFPDMDPKARYRLLAEMWDHLGRVASELPHLPGEALYQRITITGLEHLPKEGQPVIFFSGHLGNWELTYPIARRNGVPLTIVYREANNPYVDRFIAGIRGTQADNMFPKGAKGSVKMLRAIKDGLSLAMLIDQKMNDGIAVPFFGRRAMTASAIAELALRYDLPLIPARVIRTHGAHFQGIIDPPVAYRKTGEMQADVLAIMTQLNALLEGWIREHPAQWFWVHQRWPK